jgi:hypothetical protein
MDSIRIDTGIKKIQINDGPEFIEFNPSDISFAERFYQLMKDFEVKQVEYQARLDKIDANKELLDANGVPANLPEGLALLREEGEFIRERIDQLFGEDTSHKVFGNALSLEMFESFFTQITPFIQTARAAKIIKYQKVPHKKRVMS